MEDRLEPVDRAMMERCIALSRASAAAGEYPYGAVICRDGEVVCETINRVTRDRDVTRHAEVVAISEAQKVLGRTTLSDCAIYVNAEPCAFCCYAIRESRIRRVVYGLRSPVMGGVSRWNVLADTGLSDRIPEVFEPPPEILAGALEDEAAEAMKSWNPLAYEVMKFRGLFATGQDDGLGRAHEMHRRELGLAGRVMQILRRTVFDRFGRR